MGDLRGKTSDNGRSALDASSEIARSLGSVWLRFSGQRPKSTTVEMGEDVVRCVIEERAPDLGADEASDEPDGDPRLSPAGFKHNATAAIARITGRRVIAFIVKRDDETEVSTQTFLLDRPRERF
jgi:hypothetical protein